MVTKRALWLLPVLATVIWWAGYAGDANGVWPWRHEMLLLTGLLGLGYMALTLLLALPSCGLKGDEDTSYPKTEEDRRKERNGKITGDDIESSPLGI